LFNDKQNIETKAPKWWLYGEQAWQPIIQFFNRDEIKDASLWQQLKSGQSNISFRLRINAKYYFIQLPSARNNLLRPFKGKYAPLDRRLMVSPMKHWLTTHYVDLPEVCISQWVENDPQYIRFSNKQLREQLIDFLEQLHKSSTTQTEFQTNNPQQKATDLLAMPLNMEQHINHYFELAIEAQPEQQTAIELLRREGLFFAQSYEPKCFCHSDLNPYNLLWDANKVELKVIDWEYACYSDPLLDLAGLIVNWQLSLEEQNQLVEAYQQRMDSLIERQKLKDMGCLSIVLSKLWHFASHI